jgi:PTS system mannose-specific IIA component
MVRGLVITHGNLGNEMVQVVEGILGHKTDLDLLSIEWQENGRDIIEELDQYIQKHRGSKVLIFTDMFGGSPTNISLKFTQIKNIEIISGLNLPALLKFATYRDKKMSLKKLASLVQKEAVDGIHILSDLLGDK